MKIVDNGYLFLSVVLTIFGVLGVRGADNPVGVGLIYVVLILLCVRKALPPQPNIDVKKLSLEILKYFALAALAIPLLLFGYGLLSGFIAAEPSDEYYPGDSYPY